MGMEIKLAVYASDETAAVNGCKAAFARIAQIDDAASDYRKDSELMRLSLLKVLNISIVGISW